MELLAAFHLNIAFQEGNIQNTYIHLTRLVMLVLGMEILCLRIHTSLLRTAVQLKTKL